MDAQERANRALELRVSGASLTEIATTCGYETDAEAGRAISRRLIAMPRENAEQLRAIWRERFELAAKAVLPAVQLGEGDAITSLVKVGERVAKLEGLDAKQEVEITTKAEQIERLPPAEKLTLVRMQRAKLEEIERALLEQHPELRRPELIPARKGKS